jgi:predicted ATPase
MERVFIVVSCRPEFFTPWLEHSHVTMLQLNRLERELTRNMVVQVAGKPLPDDVCEQIVGRTDGAPLFVEELTRAVVELQSHKSAAGDYRSSFSLPLIIPETLADLLMARLDKAGDAKGVAHIGSAIGREFSYGLLAAVAEMPAPSLDSALARLAAPELIFVRGEPPNSTYIFKHALGQDAAYATLPGSERRQLHNRIARALEDKFPERVRTQPEMIAHRLAQAGRPEEAIDYLRMAAQRAIEQSANAEAISHLAGALSMLQLLPESTKHLRAALQLQTMLAQAMIAMRGYAAPQTREALVRARSLVSDRADCPARLAILYGLWAASYVGVCHPTNYRRRASSLQKQNSGATQRRYTWRTGR